MWRAAMAQLMKSTSLQPAAAQLCRAPMPAAAAPGLRVAAALAARRPMLGAGLRSYSATAAPSSMLAQELDGMRPQAYPGAGSLHCWVSTCGRTLMVQAMPESLICTGQLKRPERQQGVLARDGP